MEKFLLIPAANIRPGIIIIMLIFSSCVSGSVELDKLNKCEDIAQLHKLIIKNPFSLTQHCRSAQGALEENLNLRTQGNLCFVPTPSIAILSGFSCVSIPGAQAKELTCFRTSEQAFISEYKRNYSTEYKKLAETYKNTASTCEITNGNTSVTIPVLLPLTMAFISRFEFGFISPVGEGRKTDSFIQHGYASLDPSIKNVSADAIEYIELLAEADFIPDKGLVSHVANWDITTDRTDVISPMFESIWQQQNIPVFHRTISMHLANSKNFAKKERDKLMFMGRYQALLEETLLDENFTELPEEYILSHSGNTDQSFNNIAINSLPYGRREFFKSRGIYSFKMYINTETALCASQNQGALAVGVLLIKPTKNVASDYGEYISMIFGIGECADQRPEVRKYIQQIQELIVTKFHEFLEVE